MRIRTAAGVSRSGPRIRARMGLGAQVGANQRLYRIDARNFLWRLDHEAVEVRHRDGDLPASLRDPARIASEEIGTALMHVVRASYGIEPDDAVRGAVRLFGYRQAGRRIGERFRRVLEELVDDGKIVCDGTLLQMPG